MKTQILAVALIMMTGQAFATGNVEKWTGTGATFTPDGQRLAGYKVYVENTSLATGVIQSDVSITMEDGTKKISSQKLTFRGSKWSVASNHG